MKHYYFKNGKTNENMKKWGKKIPKEIPLPIYFGEWKTDDYWKWRSDNFSKLNIDKNDPYNKNFKPNKTQIKNFFSVEENPNEAYYFWIFYDYKIFCFKPKNRKIRDESPERYTDKDGNSIIEFPKVIDAEQVFSNPLEKHNLPDLFAIDSNRKYNLKTIVELSEPEVCIANYLINKENDKNALPITITKDNYLDFLSPIEFETLIFLIFNDRGSLCSSYRGGTLEGFDLKVSLKDFKHFPKNLSCNSIHWIQVKKKKIKESDKENIHKDSILIHLGEDSDDDNKNRIFGKKWLKDIIDKRPDIQVWLREMIFRYEVFKFVPLFVEKKMKQ